MSDGTPAGCRLYLRAASASVLAPLAPSGGGFDLALPIPATPALQGLAVGLQAILGPTATPLGGDLSHALWWTLR